MRLFPLMLIVAACAPDRGPSTFSQEAKTATDYDFALCMPVNYAPDDQVFHAQIEANNHGNLIYARHVEFTPVKVAGAYSTHCTLVHAAQSPDGTYTVFFDEKLTNAPDLAVIYHPAVLTHPNGGWSDLHLQISGERGDSMPYATTVSPKDGQYYSFTVVSVDWKNPVVVMRRMRPGENILPR